MYNENDGDIYGDDGSDPVPEEFARKIADPLKKAESVDNTFEARIMSAVRAGNHAARMSGPHLHIAASGSSPQSQRWTRRFARIAVASTLAAAAAIAFMVIGSRDAQLQLQQGGDPSHSVFSLHAPGAQSVILVGGFNDWRKGATTLSKSGASGTWSVSLSLPPGRHEYVFIVNDAQGERWVTDPSALSLRDEFGTESSVRLIEDRGETSGAGS